MTTVLSIIRKELRATILAPLGLLAALALFTLIIHWQHYWDNRVAICYMVALGVLGLYMGAEAVSGDKTARLLEGQGEWPISPGKWWLLRLLSQAAVTFLCGGLVYAMLAWLASHNAPNPTPVHPGLSSVWAGGLAIIPAFIIAFFASSVCRTSVQAFFLALGLCWGLAVLEYVPMMAHMAVAGMTGRMPSPPAPALYLVPWAVACVALLLGSFYGFVSTLPLEYGKRAGRAFGVLLALVIPVTIVLVGYGVYSGARGALGGGPLARGGGSSTAPSGISAARISPDGQRIAFTDGVFEQTLWVVNADGSGVHQVVPQRVHEFVWLRDSRRIVVATDVMQRPQLPRHAGSTQTKQQRQWSVVGTETTRPAAVPILQTAQSNSETARLSPQGKYLWLDGRFVEVDTWKAGGQIEMPNYSPWFLTWLPDDSAIYVYEQRFQGFPLPASAPLAQRQKSYALPIERISVPSGQMTTVPLPKAVSGDRYDPYRLNPLSESSDWCSADRSTSVAIPFDQQPVVFRSRSVRGPSNTDGHRTYADPITRRTMTRTLLYQLDGTRQIELNGLKPCAGGLSPSGRTCLVNVMDGVTEFDDRKDWHAAFVDMTTGKVIQRVTLPGLISTDSSEGEIQWSPDEQWVAQVVERWDEKARPSELLLGSVHGESKKLQLGNVDGWGASGVVGWTAADKFVVIREQSKLVAIGLDGQEQVLAQSAQPWYERAGKHSNAKASTTPAVTPSRAAQSASGQPANVAPPQRPATPGTAANYTEPTPQSFIASVLGVKPDQVTGVTPVIPDSNRYSSRQGFDWEGHVDSRVFHVSSSGPGQWSLSTPKKGAPAAEAGPTLDQTRQTATAVLKRRFGEGSTRLAESNAARLGNSGFMFSWTAPKEGGPPGDSAWLTLDAAGKVRSYKEHRAAPAVAVATPPAAGEIQETPEHFAAAILGVPASEMPTPSKSGTSWWVYQIRGRTYHVEHPPFRWGLQLWSDYTPGKTISAAQAREIARGLVNRRLGQAIAPGGRMTWKDGKISHFSFDARETLGTNIYTGDWASVVLYPDGTLMTYEERRVLPKLRLQDVKITQAKARQIADDLVRWGQAAEHTHYTFKRMWLDMRDEPFNDASYGPVWSVEYTPAGTIEDWRRDRPKFGYIRLDGMTGKVTQP